MENKRKTLRTSRGATTVVLVFVLGIFVMLPLALLGFEIARYNTILAQVQSVADAAALAGTAALASAPPGKTYAQLNQLAMDTAVLTITQNSILGTQLYCPSPLATPPASPPPTNLVAHTNTGLDTTPPATRNAVVNIELLDQNGANVPTNSTTKTAVKMRVQLIYADMPAFSFLNTKEVATAFSDGGLPQIDLFLCFDISGSMDDQTPVNLVRRYWNPGPKTLAYFKVKGPRDIYRTFGPVKSGTNVNAYPPMNMSVGNYPSPTNGNVGGSGPFEWSEGSVTKFFPTPNALIGLRANQVQYPLGTIPLPADRVASGPGEKYVQGTLIPEQGLPPGNFNPADITNLSGNGLNPHAYTNGYTDMVVDVGNQPGYVFPNLATCVEASRGNLEDDVICKRSQGGFNINATLPTRKAGYYDAYWKAVVDQAEPMKSARDAASAFYTTLNISSNAHFAFQSFSTTAGSVGGTFSGTNMNIDASYPLGGTGTFRNPLVELDKNNINYQQVLDAINGTGTTRPIAATGATNIADSLKEAVNELKSTSGKIRPQARKAIILFTDGVPNRPSVLTPPADEPDAKAKAFTEASKAFSEGIPIFTIGLSTNPSISGAQDQVLGDGNGTPNGIAALSGNGAFYVKVSNTNQLKAAFQSIARSLVVLQLKGP